MEHTHVLRSRCLPGREEEEYNDEGHPCHSDDSDGHVPLPKRERARHEFVSPGSDAQEDGRGVRNVKADNSGPADIALACKVKSQCDNKTFPGLSGESHSECTRPSK